MPSNAEVRRELMSLVSSCLDGTTTATEFLAFAAPLALDEEIDDELRGDLDRLSLVADEVVRFDLAPEVFLDAVRAESQRELGVDLAPAAD